MGRCSRCARGLLPLPLAGLGLLVAVLLLRTYSSPGPPDWAPGEGEQREEASAEERARWKEVLKGAIRIPTVSFSEDEQNTTALGEFTEYIRKVFPGIFSCSFIQHEIIADYSHLFTVQGSNPQLEPYMMLAHLDVVPASDEGWDHPPFSAQEVGGYIYGRGTLDNKGSAIGLLQALELLLKRKHRPRRSFYVGLGHDEEISGQKGARRIAAKLESRGARLSFLTDEGLAILDGVIQGLSRPIAMVGTTEKGAITLALSVETQPGHSSMPPRETSIGILAAAVSRSDPAEESEHPPGVRGGQRSRRRVFGKRELQIVWSPAPSIVDDAEGFEFDLCSNRKPGAKRLFRAREMRSLCLRPMISLAALFWIS